ncbi:MAG TPA: formyltransferase family protein [Sphingobium sp.]|nr:formyltransferase family protein [Sphingobium sp.]
MRALLIGAVEGTGVALDVIGRAPGWHLVAVATLPPELATRHSDFVDLGPAAAQANAPLITVANGNAPAFIEQVKALDIDYAFVIGWSQICGPEFRDAVNGRVVGYHPAALPRLRGRAVIPWTILLDEKITASTLFRLDEGVDSGPIIAQKFFHVAPDETAGTLYAKHMRALRHILEDALPRLAAGDDAGEPQDHRLATWAARRRPKDGRIDWTRPAADVARLIRAVGRPYPGAWTRSGEAMIIVWEAESSSGGKRHHGYPGQIIAADAEGIVLLCGDGEALRITRYDAPPDFRVPVHSVLGG